MASKKLQRTNQRVQPRICCNKKSFELKQNNIAILDVVVEFIRDKITEV